MFFFNPQYPKKVKKKSNKEKIGIWCKLIKDVEKNLRSSFLLYQHLVIIIIVIYGSYVHSYSLNLKPCNFIDRYIVNLNTIERKNRKK